MKWFSAQAQAPSNKQPRGCNHRKHLLIDSSHPRQSSSRGKKPERQKSETKRNARAPSVQRLGISRCEVEKQTPR